MCPIIPFVENALYHTTSGLPRLLLRSYRPSLSTQFPGQIFQFRFCHRRNQDVISIKLPNIISSQSLHELLIREHSFQHTILTVKYKLDKPFCYLQLTQIQEPVSTDRRNTLTFFCLICKVNAITKSPCLFIQMNVFSAFRISFFRKSAVE